MGTLWDVMQRLARPIDTPLRFVKHVICVRTCAQFCLVDFPPFWCTHVQLIDPQQAGFRAGSSTASRTV